MKTILYVGMENKPYEVDTMVYVNERYLPVTLYYIDGKKVMLKANRSALAYSPAHDNMQYPNHNLPIIQAGKVVSPEVLDKGYSSHDFELIIL